MLKKIKTINMANLDYQSSKLSQINTYYGYECQLG